MTFAILNSMTFDLFIVHRDTQPGKDEFPNVFKLDFPTQFCRKSESRQTQTGHCQTDLSVVRRLLVFHPPFSAVFLKGERILTTRILREVS